MTMAHRQCWSFHSAGRIVFGSGSVARLAEFLDPWKPTRVLIVTDRMLVQAGVVDRVAAPLLAAGLDVSRFEGGQKGQQEASLHVGGELMPAGA